MYNVLEQYELQFKLNIPEIKLNFSDKKKIDLFNHKCTLFSKMSVSLKSLTQFIVSKSINKFFFLLSISSLMQILYFLDL